MRHPRYFAILGGRDPFGMRRVIEERAQSEAGLVQVLAAPNVRVFADGQQPLVLSGDAGVIVGRIHHRNAAMSRLEAADANTSRLIVASGGQRLIDDYWGDYVAIIAGTGRAMVLRSPFGNLGCLHVVHRGVHLVASDLALLKRCIPLITKPDWDALASHLLTGGLRGNRTCVADVKELLWGSRLVVADADASVEPCWSPWAYANDPRHGASDALADDLLQTARSCIAAQIRGLDHVLVMLSGGLDSSLLASCVATSGVPLTCINLTTGDTAGDERAYARQVAARLGTPCYEAAHEIARVDVVRSEAEDLARPIARSFAQATRFAKLAVARVVGANAVLDGGGGDNLFCSLQSVAPVADRLLHEGLSRGIACTARDISRLTEASVPTVLARALRRAWLRPPAYRWPVDRRFLSAEAVVRAGPPTHRWLDAPWGALPGSAAHVALLIAVENLLETKDGAIPEWAPLMAQPLVELCLSIPSWQWYENGHNRAIARRALAQRLPPEIAWRRGKGSPDAFVARVFEANRPALRALLLDGRLADEGLLDRDAVAALLARDGPVKGNDHNRLLRIADIEAWVRTL